VSQFRRPLLKEWRNCKLILRKTHGWEGDTVVTHQLQEGVNSFEFDVPDEYEWIHSTSITDGLSFAVSCEYTNSTEAAKKLAS
jgi:hypothetical protein